VAVENRYLAERIIIENNDTRTALKPLRDRLARNRVVSIGVAEPGQRTLDAKFLNGALRVATWPPDLARTTGAPLLPVFATRMERDRYEVTIGRALAVDDEAAPPYTRAIREYATMLEPFVSKYADQWSGWMALGRLAETMPSFLASFKEGRAIAQEMQHRRPSS
jgi:lauroyl/myristoyl acyltransferase